MQDRLAARLESLRAEYRTGQSMLAELEAKELEVRQTLLRIAGAIQVLEELRAEAGASGPGLAPNSARTAGGPDAERPGPSERPAGRAAEAGQATGRVHGIADDPDGGPLVGDG